jgi:hypothetical protein
MSNGKFFRLDLNDLSPEFRKDDPSLVPNPLIRIERTRGDFCGCCGGACIRTCRGQGRVAGMVTGAVAMATVLTFVVLLLILLLSIQSPVVLAESGSGNTAVLES